MRGGRGSEGEREGARERGRGVKEAGREGVREGYLNIKCVQGVYRNTIEILIEYSYTCLH